MQDEYKIIGKIMAIYPEMENITEDEQRFFDEWIVKGDNKELFDSIVDNQTRKADLAKFLQIRNTQNATRKKYYAAIEDELNKNKVVRWRRWPYYIAAASVIVVLGIVGHVWFNGKQKSPETRTPAIVQTNDVKPGQFKAKLTLADGSVMKLDSISNGRLVQQGSTSVYSRNGQLIYQAKGKQNEVLYNTLTTEKGQIYMTLLSDGTKVWLNSQSSLRYPVAFVGKVRKVEITGEAYFEVAHAAGHPFIVNANGMDVTVVGTHFNISSYEDEAEIKTTLLEGKVTVAKGNSLAELAPGQQALLNKQTEKIIKKEHVDVDEVVAWRYGYFRFSDANLQTVLRQLMRWYDVDISYEGKLPDMTFLGKIPRNSNLSNVLKILETNEVHFRIEGKKIVVSP
jgi:transmembrane sensor